MTEYLILTQGATRLRWNSEVQSQDRRDGNIAETDRSAKGLSFELPSVDPGISEEAMRRHSQDLIELGGIVSPSGRDGTEHPIEQFVDVDDLLRGPGKRPAIQLSLQLAAIIQKHEIRVAISASCNGSPDVGFDRRQLFFRRGSWRRTISNMVEDPVWLSHR
jgi:hypothetical protein